MTSCRLWLIAAFWTLAALCPLSSVRCELPADLQAQLVRHGHAFIIAAWKYRDPGWGDISVVRSQVDVLRNGLAPHFGENNITTLLNPTVEGLRRALRTFFSETGDNPDDRLFVYYVGHGFTDLSSGTGFITGIDTPHYTVDDRRAARNAISLREYDEFTRNSRAPQVLTVFDSCFAGTIFSAALGPILSPTLLDYQRVRSMLRKPVRYYITAGGPNEEVSSDYSFEKTLLRGIDGAASTGDGFVTGEELGIFLAHTVPNETGRLLRPLFGAVNNADFAAGQFVFATPYSRAFASAQGPTQLRSEEQALLSPSVKIPPAVPESELQPPLPLSYLVFFDYASAGLTDRARQLVREAALASTHVRYSQIEVNGYTEFDLGPTASEMIGLSQQRAAAVAAELVRDGVPGSVISLHAFGGSHLLVPTPAGVREPQNRRVEIIIR